ncbi:hypothetical protein Tco_0780568 [Tanacetum coccineum]
MTRSLNKELFTPYKESERVLRSARKFFKATSLDYSSSPEFDLFYDLKDQSGIARPKIDENARFELKGQFLKELHDSTFSGLDNEDANEHIEKVLEIVELFHIPEVTQDQIMLRVFHIYVGSDHVYKGLDMPTRQILDSNGAIPKKIMKATDAKKAIQYMANHSKKWHNGTSIRTRKYCYFDGFSNIQLN